MSEQSIKEFEMESQGIQETKDLLKFVVSLGMAVDKIKADGKVDITDIQFLMSPLTQAGKAFEGVKHVKSQLKDLSAEEAKELVEFAENQLDLSNDKLEHTIETALKLGLDIFNYVELFKSIKKA
jgi:uncharacterized NAD-dependent epimerase/dehydratase family protein